MNKLTMIVFSSHQCATYHLTDALWWFLSWLIQAAK